MFRAKAEKMVSNVSVFYVNADEADFPEQSEELQASMRPEAFTAAVADFVAYAESDSGSQEIAALRKDFSQHIARMIERHRLRLQGGDAIDSTHAPDQPPATAESGD